MFFWTAGYEWDKERYIWCPSGETLPNFNSWSGVTNKIKGEGNCILAQLADKSKALVSADCNSKNFFFCEVWLLKIIFFLFNLTFLVVQKQ